MIFSLSPSSISLMNECPRCFWLSQHKIWKRPNGIFSSLPNGMDIIIKNHFDNYRTKGRLPPELASNSCCKNARLFGINDKERVLLTNWRNNFRGVSWADSQGNRLRGAIDDILTRGNKLIILDFKTRGYSIKENTKDFYQNSMDLYSFLLTINNYKTEDCAFLLFYIPQKILETGEIVFYKELVQIEVSPDRGRKLFEAAICLLQKDCPCECCEWCKTY